MITGDMDVRVKQWNRKPYARLDDLVKYIFETAAEYEGINDPHGAQVMRTLGETIQENLSRGGKRATT